MRQNTSISSNDFLVMLQLRSERFSSVSLDGLLLMVHDFTSAVWQQPQLHHFVDHGIDHSYRVANKALNILDKIMPDGVGLSAIERLILGLGCLMHDVGMQYNRYPVGGIQKSNEDIRKAHCELGYEMIRDALEGKFSSERAGPKLPLEDIHKMFIGYGALVGFSHGGIKYWNRLRESVYAERKEGGLQVRRLRLLASVLRLADELHTEYTRIPELNWVGTSQLSPKEKAHWAACYYTQELKLSSPGTAGLRISMSWRAPNKADESEVALIRGLLQELRERKICNEFDLVKEFLKYKEGMEDCFFECRMEREPERVDILPLPKEVATFVTSELRPYQFGTITPPQYPRISELASAPRIDELKDQAQRFFLYGEGTLKGHYRLKTGWHTNNYVRCRNLTADMGFSTELCQALTQLYSGHRLTHVISVGTSALKIGALLSFLLPAYHSFTFGDAQIIGELAGRQHYTEYEQEVIIPAGARVLIIDDILGVGSVVEKMVGRLTSLVEPPTFMMAFCIYALGDLTMAANRLGDLKVDYLVAFPDVVYRKENPITRTCEICQGSPHIAHDE